MKDSLQIPFTVNHWVVNRVEVIDESGRVYTRRDIKDVQFSFQDDGRTLKIFISGVIDDNKG